MRTKESLPLTGYADPLSAAPGETVRFMVSSPNPYDAALVRLRHGDDDPAGPGLRETEVASAVAARHPGRTQPIHAGSCGVAAAPGDLELASLTLQAWVMPTLLGRDSPQAIVARWDPPAGVALVVEPEGDLALWIGRGGGVARARTAVPLLDHEWYFVAATFDARTGHAVVEQRPVGFWPRHPSAATAHADLGASPPARCAAPFTLGAAGIRPPFEAHLNGRVDRPRVFSRALTGAELARLADGAAPADVAAGALVAAWDLTRSPESTAFVDTGPLGLHGSFRNEPARPGAGAHWRRREVDWRRAPEEYSSVHFHEDDIADCEWEPDVELVVPDRLPSGVYALRLRDDEGAEDHVPFFVHAPVGEQGADVCVVFPTLTYLAYGNDRCSLWWWIDGAAPWASYPVEWAPYEGSPHVTDADVVLRDHPELGCSNYDRFNDGSGPVYSSYRRPLLTMRPRWRWWATGQPRHFSADLYLVDWLHEHGYEHDVMTDHDLHEHGDALIGGYRTVVLVGHPEYWTERMMDALEAYIRRGGRVMCLGGNALVWAPTVNPSRPWLMEVRKGPRYGVPTWESVHSTGELGGEWSFRDRTGRRLLGLYYSGYGWPERAPGYWALKAAGDERAAFIFEGVDRDELIGDFGALQQGAAGDEVDASDRRDGTPAHALVVASSAGLHGAYEIAGGWSAALRSPGPTGVDNPDLRAEIVYFEGPDDGAVFAVGSINWCGSLAWNGSRNNVSRITRNVLDRFLMPRD